METGRRFGGFLLVAGAVVGVVAVVGLVVGFQPSRLPPALLDIAAYKLTFAAAAGLLAAGAIVRRRSQSRKHASSPPVADARAELGAGQSAASPVKRPEPEGARRTER